METLSFKTFCPAHSFVLQTLKEPQTNKNISNIFYFFLDKSEVNCIVWMNQNEWEQWSYKYICDMDLS